MSALDRAAEAIDPDAFRTRWEEAHDPRALSEGMLRQRLAREAAERLNANDLLVSEERDREVAARALRVAADYLNETYRADDVLEPDVDDLSAHLLRRRADRIAGGE